MIKVTHVSRDNNIKVFYPRIPKHRVFKENNTIRRVCVSTNVRNCIQSFPYRSDLIWDLYNIDKGTYLVVYEFYINEKHVLEPKKVFTFGVPDAMDNKEHWVMKRCKPYRKQIIRIMDFKLSKYNKYTWEYYGEITKLKYKYSVEGHDRILKDTIYEYSNYIKLKRLFIKLGVEIIEENIEEYYFGYGYPVGDCCLPKYISNKKRKVAKIKYRIPSGVDVYYAWDLIISDNNKFEKKRATLLKQDIVDTFSNHFVR